MANAKNITRVGSVFHDKYGRAHTTSVDAAFANRCYEMMQWLTMEQGLQIADAERIVADMMEFKTARNMWAGFLEQCIRNAASKTPLLADRHLPKKQIRLRK